MVKLGRKPQQTTKSWRMKNLSNSDNALEFWQIRVGFDEFVTIRFQIQLVAGISWRQNWSFINFTSNDLQWHSLIFQLVCYLLSIHFKKYPITRLKLHRKEFDFYQKSLIINKKKYCECLIEFLVKAQVFSWVCNHGVVLSQEKNKNIISRLKSIL